MGGRCGSNVVLVLRACAYGKVGVLRVLREKETNLARAISTRSALKGYPPSCSLSLGQ